MRRFGKLGAGEGCGIGRVARMWKMSSFKQERGLRSGNSIGQETCVTTSQGRLHQMGESSTVKAALAS